MSQRNINAKQQGSIELTLTNEHRKHQNQNRPGHGRNKLKEDTSSHNQVPRKGFRESQDTNDNTFGYFLLEASKNGNPSEMESLMRDGANPNVIDTFGRSPLHLALSNECSCITCVKDAEACVALLLSSNAVDVNLQDETGKTPLHLSVDNQLIRCSEMLISYGADVTIKCDSGIDAVRLMATKLPQCLIYLLNESIYVDQFDPHHEKCVLKVDFRPIVGDEVESVEINPSPGKDISYSPNNKSTNSHRTKKDENYGREMKLLTFLLQSCKFSGEKILTHPVVEIFLHLKWKRVRRFFWFSFICYIFWVIMYTSYVLRVYLFNCPCDLFTRSNNSTKVPALSNLTDNDQASKKKCEIETGLGVEVLLIIIATVLLLLFEVGKLVVAPRIYLKSWLNAGNWILILLVFSTTIPTLTAQNSISAVQYQAAAFTVFLAWAYILPQIGRLPSLSKYVEIFGHVLRCFGSFVLTFASLYMAFALAFCILFPGDNSPFAYAFYSILKVFVMSVGELDYQDMFYSESATDPFSPVMGHLLYILFVIIVCVILMNLFVGLTVSDIQALEKQAEFARVCRLIVEILHLEVAIFSKRIPKAIARFLKSSLAVCQPERIEKDGLTFTFRPNKRDDKSLGESLKRSALHLAEASFRKSRSHRCSKGQYEDGHLENPELIEVASYFSPAPSATSSQSSSPLETNSLDIADLGTRNDAYVHLKSWNSCGDQR